ncbi:PBP1A family penicillin-binding protein [Sphingomonas sp.]|jgi:penicillin-binding protein 1A|uniref:transglycosylase domain-containing protein n=1 Tax=Sphingomonas sp. TaxID=28214 RepID=UPI002EDB91E0
MARDPIPNDVRFPLRRQADSQPEPPAPRPEAKLWKPRAARPEPLELTGGLPPPEAEPVLQRVRRAVSPPPPPPPPPNYGEAALAGGYTTNLPVAYRKRSWKWLTRSIAAFVVLFIVAVGWLALTAPLSKSLQPPAPPSITLLSAEGKAIARRGAVIGAPVDAAKLPKHVRDAFVAIEDRRFYGHMGIDPRGIMRAFVHNVTSDDRSQGGSTITQQLAKNAFLSSDRTATRKFQEVLIAFWLEGWLSKDEILSRYLSNVYFGDNVYGLSAASQHYFSCDADALTISQATLLAGLVQAPSRLAPTGNLKGARDRQRLVIAAMVSAGLLTKGEAARVRPAVLKLGKTRELPNGTYFADWVLPQARDRAGEVATEQTVETTLEIAAQQAAERAVKNAGLNRSQVAIVAMRPDGRVIAMVGGRNYSQSTFNRATQARRQPGSTFKLFVYLAALRAGMTPDTVVDDSPVQIGDWKPANSDGRYAGRISLRQAFAKSSNVVAARLTQQLGVARVTQAARDLGISTPIGNDASVGLGTSTVSLLELTAAYAAVANGSYPVRPQGLSDDEAASDWLARRLGAPQRFSTRQLDQLRELLSSVVQSGTGRGAALPIPAFGKTGTTQDNRDALFIGYAGGIVTGVWLGNDDNSPNPGLSGSGLPARVWRDFMTRALNLRIPPPEPTTEPDNFVIDLEDVVNGVGAFIDGSGIETEILRPRDGEEEPIAPEDEEGPPDDRNIPDRRFPERRDERR